ncbi:small multi-drug export protein [Amycolatopsis jiangsuensis]|uniref:Small multi-drug export protein n=1 Tax=Amycolatopsis jiangsuensis TaxID=1181879 RepID=A0A840J1Y5_9PSEU|nr:small multi-drug export protein [Amycolatopsis jiangsuensis]MBB4689081.1 hypothetical protein [Amycolatopsis jiangsuensis]
MIENLQHFVGAWPGALQWIGVALVAFVPFVESYLGSVIGVVIGVHPIAAVICAVLGNIAVMVAIAFITDSLRKRATRDKDREPRPGRARARKLFDRFGVPGVALLGHPTQISTAALIAFGAPRTKVIVWELISIVLWGAVTTTFAAFGISALA